MRIIPITESDIKSIIPSLKPNKLSDYNEVTSEILKYLHLPLSYIYNYSLHTGIFSDQIKIAVVKPLYKKEDKTCMTNYKTFSVITVFSKILEKTMPSRLSQHMHTDNILVRRAWL
jgi:hypothetical protein